MELRVATITHIERHPKADKLYIETIDLGNEIAGSFPGSSLTIERKTSSAGILSSSRISNQRNFEALKVRECFSLLIQTVRSTFFSSRNAKTGGSRKPEGFSVQAEEKPSEIDIDTFFSIPLRVEKKTVRVGDTALVCNGKEVTSNIENGKVG